MRLRATWQMVAFRLNSVLFHVLAINRKDGSVRAFTVVNPDHWAEAPCNTTVWQARQLFAVSWDRVNPRVRAEIKGYLHGGVDGCSCNQCSSKRETECAKNSNNSERVWGDKGVQPNSQARRTGTSTWYDWVESGP